MIPHVIELARETGLQVCLDMASCSIIAGNLELSSLLINKYVGIVFANEEKAKAFTDKEDPKEALKLISKKCNIAIIKVGGNSFYIRKGTEGIEVKAIPVERVINMTGIGDYFTAEFLHGLTCGYSLGRCVKIDSVSFEDVIQIVGTTIPYKRWDEIESNINEALSEQVNNGLPLHLILAENV